jgi:hypothetical protein
MVEKVVNIWNEDGAYAWRFVVITIKIKGFFRETFTFPELAAFQGPGYEAGVPGCTISSWHSIYNVYCSCACVY